jgi:hypothetical protein
MAVVQIADIYNPFVFAGMAQEAQTQLNKFITSGIAVMSPMLQQLISGGGNQGELPNFAPLGIPAPNLSTDNPATFSVPNKITSEKCRFRLITQNQEWSTMNIANELALQDPVMAITGRIGEYWATVLQTEIINFLMGILADNIANDSSDMLYKIGTDAAGAVTAAERISGPAVLRAKQTLGDGAAKLTHIGMSSLLYTRLQEQELIVYLQTANTNVQIPTYLGYTVVVDDQFPAVAGVNRILYTVVLFGQGALGMASGRIDRPSELFRVPGAGNGGGQDLIFSRRNDLITAFGFDFTSASVAGQSATYAELALAANHNRIWSRKNIPIAYLQVND